MDFFEVIQKRRSIRHFTSEPVPEEDLRTMLEAARLAPSATNEQPWRFIVIRDQSLKDSMRDMVEAIVDVVAQTVTDEARKKRLEGMRLYSTHFAGVPAAIAVLARPWIGGGYSSPEESTPRDLGLISASAAMSFILLAATALGYATCFASGPAEFARRELEGMLGVDAPWFLVGVISVGKPAWPPGARPPRKPVEEIAAFIG